MDDPVAFLEKVKHRVVTMHASDRYLAPGATLDDLKTEDGATGYASALKHGVTGEGMNDYDAMFRILSSVGFSGWRVAALAGVVCVKAPGSASVVKVQKVVALPSA